MRIVKPQPHVPVQWLWDYKENERDIDVVDALEKSYVLFGIFMIDKFARDFDSELRTLMEKVKSHIALWNDYYPWSESNGISVGLEKLENGMSFIYGQLCAENNICREENLVLGLLTNLSRNLNPQVFIRICDTDGDFIMNEVSNSLPKGYEFPVACNRLWLSCGKLKIIPLQEKFNGEIRPLEALKFLEHSPFKLLDLDAGNAIGKMTENFPNNVLSRLVKLPLVVENNEHRDILLQNPQLISFFLKGLIDDEIEVTDLTPESEVEAVDFLVSKEHCDLIPFFFEANGLSKDTELVPIICGRAISKVIEKLLANGTILAEETGTSKAPPLARRGSLFDLSKFSPISIDMTLPANDTVDLTKNLMENLQNAFGSEVKIDDSLINDDYDDSEGRISTDLDEECRKYFYDEGIDIDEDDFFEFFLKEGLKLGPAKIDDLRTKSER